MKFLTKLDIHSFYKSLCKPLTHAPLRQLAYILSHGGIHLILLIGLSVIIYHLYKLSITEIGPQYHEIHITSNDFNYLSIVAEISSEDLYSKVGYNQSISISYTPKSYNHDSIFHDSIAYSTSFEIARYPYKTNWEFSDNIQNLAEDEYLSFEDYAYKIKTSNDSLLGFTLFSGSKKFTYSSNYYPKEQSFTIYGNELLSSKKEDNNPYYYFYLRLDYKYDIPGSLDYTNYYNIIIQFGDYSWCGDDVRMTKPIKYQYIFPEPDQVGSGHISYISKQKIKEVMENRGILIQAEDINLKNQVDRMGFVYTILLGAMIAFWLDIFVNLVIKWRNLNLNS